MPLSTPPRNPGRKGVATSLVTSEDTDIYYDLKNVRLTQTAPPRAPLNPAQLLTESGNVVPHELSAHPASRKKPSKEQDFGRNIEA
jgi:hypothetical protein